ncbi:MAG TPA: GNAT family protein [Thermomicrobiales bacterium]|nr:GNAT family protein [Thermomicrobiales bacterium]
MNNNAEEIAYRIRPLTEVDAKQVCTWRYPDPYAFYDIGESNLAELLDPAHNYIAVEDEAGALAGFFTFGQNARVIGAQRSRLYSAPALDIGLGMRPDVTGRGNGLRFVRAGLVFAAERFRPRMLRLVVAAFNIRAIRVYDRAGFVAGPTFTSPVRETEVPFLLMTRLNPELASREGVVDGVR